MSSTMLKVMGGGGAQAVLPRLQALCGPLAGVSSVRSGRAGLLLIDFDPSRISLGQLLAAARSEGHEVKVVDL